MKPRFIKPVITKNIGDDHVVADDEPLSPAARLFQSTELNCSIIIVLGSNSIIDVDAVKSGLMNSMVKHPRFSSLFVIDDKNGGQMSWRRTEVDIHKHVFALELDPNMELPDQFVEDYASNLTKTGLDPAKPLWELHVLNVKTSDANATAILKLHHSIGDGISIMSLFLASSRIASDLESLPSLPKPKRPTSFWNNCRGFWGILFTIWTVIMMVFNTFVDVMNFAATALFLKDTDTPLKGTSEKIGLSRKRMVHRIISLDDIKLVKSAMNTTINDVLLGITMAGLSRYLNGKYATRSYPNEMDQITGSKNGNHLPENIRFRSTLLYNLRPSTGIESLAEMMEKESKVRWGNLIGYVLLPITIALPDDPLDYVRKAKAIVDRKKFSFEALCTYSVGRFILDLFGLKQTAAVMYKTISNTTMSFSNVVGPREEISFYGHHLSYLAPSVYGQPQALTVHWQSYGEKMILVLTVDPDVIPDYNNLCTDFEASVKLIKDAVIQSKAAGTVQAKTGHKQD
ncbi:O-acyltransferase WSD1-like [Heracleum sosnowskyi]|uniref:O-acyltransferase WSD1-like n=1 Tax=Heracleum sosnowskyi TaxID=360622 RepID=A0AAD8J7S8_9APIA|nr:O-acyltransferase WSD1-like [Heracleum sosnowskyi]